MIFKNIDIQRKLKAVKHKDKEKLQSKNLNIVRQRKKKSSNKMFMSEVISEILKRVMKLNDKKEKGNFEECMLFEELTHIPRIFIDILFHECLVNSNNAGIL